jgi:hypothetical protein
MALIDVRVRGYFVVLRMSSEGDPAERTVQLNLEDTDLLGLLRFVDVQPEAWVVFTETRVTVFLPLRFFTDLHHLLQTEGPLRFFARADEDPPFFLFSVGTLFEPVGEGTTDAGEGP